MTEEQRNRNSFSENMAEVPAKRKCPSYEQESLDLMGETDIDLEAFSFTWTIRKYEYFGDLVELKSPTFQGGPKTKHGWQLVMRNHMVRNTKYVSIFLELTEYGDGLGELTDTSVTTHFQISILRADGQVIPFSDDFTKKKTIHEFKKGSTLCRRSQMIKSDVLIALNRHFIVNDTLKIFCQVWIPSEIKEKVTTSKWEPSDEHKTKVCKDRFVTDFGKMFSEAIATDCTVSTGKISFKAHKVILSARSSVFAAMFNVDMMERKTATVKITDFDNEVVKGMLEHLHTGETAAMAARAQELLQIAEKYNLEGLKEDCEYVIADKLSKDSAAEILVLAHSHNAPILKEHAINFINWNKEELMKMESFQEAVKASTYPGLFDGLCLGAKK